MRRKHLILLALLLLSRPVLAQDKPVFDPCASNREVIAGLNPPRYATPAVWDASYGRLDRQVQLFSSVPGPDGTVVALGRVTGARSARPLATTLVRLDRRGTVIAAHDRPAEGWELPVKLLTVPGGYVALSDIRADGGRKPSMAKLSWYGAAGVFRHATRFTGPVDAVESTAVTRAGDGYIVLLHAVPRDPAVADYAIIVRLSSSGAVLWRRALKPGAGAMLTAITASGQNFVAAGRIESDDDRPSGWLVAFDRTGNLLWQRPYARGGSSVLDAAAPAGAGVAVAGSTRPVGGGRRALWIMVVDSGGDPLWQRFYRRDDTDYRAVGLAVGRDARLTVMADAFPDQGSGQLSHVRLMTLSPIGVMLGDEAYVTGAGVYGYDLAEGWNGERIVTASADQGRDGQTGLRYQGWIVVATALDKWINLCLKASSR